MSIINTFFFKKNNCVPLSWNTVALHPHWRAFIQKRFEFVCKPSSVVYGHLSRLTVTDKLKRYSRYSVGRTALLTDTQSCSEWGLHGILCYHNIGELLPRLSILTARYRTAVYFCCTILEVTFTWRYQAPCPMLLGLSSWHNAPRPYNKLKSFIL